MNFFTTYGGSTIFMPSLWMHHNIHYTKNSWQNHTVWEQINNFRAHFTFGKRLLKNNLQFFSTIQSPVKSSAKSSYCSSARAFCLVTYLLIYSMLSCWPILEFMELNLNLRLDKLDSFHWFIKALLLANKKWSSQCIIGIPRQVHGEFFEPNQKTVPTKNLKIA